MKRKILIFLMILSVVTLITGCGSKKEKKENISKEIEEFIIENMPGNWIYSEDKVKINDDNTIELNFYDNTDWAYCGNVTNKAIISLTKDENDILKKIPSITAICKNEDLEVIAKTVYTSLSDITDSNIESNAKYYDAKGNIVDANVEETYKNNCVYYKYNEILAEPASYYRKHIKLNAEVVQVTEEKILDMDYWTLSVLMKNDETGTYDDEVLIILDKTIIKETPSLNDVYKFYGEIMAPSIYENEDNEEVTIPTVYVLYATKK